MGHVTRCLVSLVALLALSVEAQDITAGHTFVNGETVTANSMNAIVGSATIGTSFYTAKTPATTINAADSFLFYSSGLAGFRTISEAYLLLTNQDLVNSMFNTADYARRSNFLAGVDEVARSNFLNSAAVGTVSNFVSGFWNYGPSPSNQLNWDRTNMALVPAWNTTNSTWQYAPQPFRFTSGNLTFASVTNVAHGLPGTPQRVEWVLRCLVSDNVSGHLIGDEIRLGSVSAWFTNATFNYSVPAFQSGANSSNLFLYPMSSASANFAYYFLISTNGSTVAMTNGNWSAKCYATYYP